MQGYMPLVLGPGPVQDMVFCRTSVEVVPGCGDAQTLFPYNLPDGPPHPLPLWAKHLSPGVQIGLGTESFRSGSTRMTHCLEKLKPSNIK
jgi:hypothetical protein